MTFPVNHLNVELESLPALAGFSSAGGPVRNDGDRRAAGRETWSNIVGKNSLVKWAVTSHRRHRRELPLRLAPPQLTDVSVIRLRSSAEVDRWFASLPAPQPRP